MNLEQAEKAKEKLMIQAQEKLSTLKQVKTMLTEKISGQEKTEMFKAWLDIEIEAAEDNLDNISETSPLELF